MLSWFSKLTVTHVLAIVRIVVPHIIKWAITKKYLTPATA